MGPTEVGVRLYVDSIIPHIPFKLSIYHLANLRFCKVFVIGVQQLIPLIRLAKLLFPLSWILRYYFFYISIPEIYLRVPYDVLYFQLD